MRWGPWARTTMREKSRVQVKRLLSTLESGR